ncbi:MAG: hypothetical protein PHQ75_05435, partial [Thermoguttaceae bacterium]|nr:hypothetical protein [Thermoguttaceae bacterium]
MRLFSELFGNRVPVKTKNVNKGKGAEHSSRRTGGHYRKLRLESLEERQLLAVWTVNTTADVAPEAWSTSDTEVSLREAITQAVSGDEINFNIAGENLTEAQRTITLDATLGQLVIDKNLTINGLNTGDTAANIILDGGDLYDGTTVTEHSGVRIMNIAAGTTVSLTNLTFQHGYFSDTDVGGGAIYNLGTLTISNSTFTGNSADCDGGAISTKGNLTVTNSVFSHNSTVLSSKSGGAVNGANNTSALMSFDNCVFSQNSAGFGGAICSYKFNQSITNSTFTGNSANGGGAVYNSTNSVGTITNSTFTGNSASTSGGAIYNNKILRIANSTITGNSAGTDSLNYGGGIYNPGESLYLLNSIVVDNTAGEGVQDTYTLYGNTYYTYAYYSLFGKVVNIGSDKLFTTSAETSVGKTVAYIFANVTDGKAVASTKTVNGVTQTYFDLKTGGDASGTGAFTWHNTDWTAVAYSSTKTSEPFYIIETTGADTMIATDQIGNTIPAAASRGAVIVKEAPSVIVTTTDDVVDEYDGLISLREAIAYAGAEELGSNITFNIPGADLTDAQRTITLAPTLGQLEISKNLTINGLNTGDTAANIILDGGDLYDGTTVTEHSGVRIMNIAAGTTVSLTNLTFQNGYTLYDSAVTNSGFGGAIYNAGTLTISNSTFTGNSVSGTGLHGRGGAIANAGTLTVSNSMFSENSASDQNSSGGAIYNYDSGTLTVSHSTFTGNSTYWNGGA